MLAGGFAQACWLQQRGSPLPAAVVLCGVGLMAWGLWQLHRRFCSKPLRLLLLPDGQVILHAGNTPIEARPRPCSLRLGRHVLLVLHAHDGRQLRLLLGPGILSASDLAALGRWLQRLPGSGETAPGVAVDSQHSHRSGLIQ